MKDRHYLIVEGGGFKTGFTSGILDAFVASKYNPFDGYIGVSGGAVAVSYFVANQYRQALLSILYLAKDPNFLNYLRLLSKKGYMDIDTLGRVSTKIIPFDIVNAIKFVEDKDLRFVVTERKTGNPAYLRPSADTWIDYVIASCTLPFVTKGSHLIDEHEYFDGGWSDPLPVLWAAKQGATKITVLRTWPLESKSSQSWPDYFGSKYYRDTPGLSNSFANNHLNYNMSLDFMKTQSDVLTIEQIAPKKLLKSGTYSYSKKTIMSDYRYGVDVGLNHVMNMQATND